MSNRYWQRLWRRQRKGVAWLAGLFVVDTLVGFFVLPAVIRWQALKQLPSLLKREVTVRQVRVNPWTLSLTVRGLEVTEPDGGRFAAWEEFYANFQVSSLFRRICSSLCCRRMRTRRQPRYQKRCRRGVGN